MSDLNSKNFIVALSGGIAAYKTASLVRLLIKEGANVKVVMTDMAKEFISPLTLATLSKNPVLVDFYNPENGDWNSHVDLGLWADAYIIAPATANTMAKMANAVADNLLVTTYLSARCPVFVVPAMDLDMFIHPANQNNIHTLKSFGNIIIEPPSGELASGLSGKGRMEEPENIISIVKDYFQKKKFFANKKILITAGPTHEKIDAVRFIGNYSSGKMGYAIAEELADCGAEVILISGPIKLPINNKNIKIVNVKSAEEMFEAAMRIFPDTNAAIMTAAVADFTPEKVIDIKIKREKSDLNLVLKPTKDIAEAIGKIKKETQILAGFALESENEIENAKKKIKNKNLDFIVLNSLNNENTCFDSDFNKISIINNKSEITEFEFKNKTLVAKDIIKYLYMVISNK
jgi:phosphopantothenoylcysteine decarboxylase / phosphopantothenate---cysteine ligase